MTANIEKVADRIMKALQRTDRTVTPYDSKGSEVVDLSQARRFLTKPDNLEVTITDEDRDMKITFYLSNAVDIRETEELRNALKNIVMQFNAQFDIRRFGKDVRPKNLKYELANAKESHRRDTMANTLEEGKNKPYISKTGNEWTVLDSEGNEAKTFANKDEAITYLDNNFDMLNEGYNPMTGTRRRSVQQWNEAKLIIKHTKAVNEQQQGARARNISKIFVETTEGERFKFPNTHLQGARAMARHVGAGGSFQDSVGQHIIGLSEEFRAMGKVSTHIQRNRTSLEESAMDLRETVRGRMKDIRESLNSFMTKKGYSKKVAEVEDIESAPLNEDDLSATIATLSNDLHISEEDGSMMSALSRVASLVFEAEPAPAHKLEHPGIDADLVRRAWGPSAPKKPAGSKEDDFGYTSREYNETQADFDAAAELLQTGKFKWLPKMASSEQKKDEMDFASASPLFKLQWRLGAMAERLDPKVPGQNTLSVILSRLAAKFDTPNEKGKIEITSAENEIKDHFLKIAPSINESLQEAGYTNWNAPILNETEEVEEQVEEDANEEQVDEEKLAEACELDKWFEAFDPAAIIQATVPVTEADDCECGDDCDCDDCDCNEAEEATNETEVTKMVNKGLIESEAYDAAYKLANNERTIEEARELFDDAEFADIVASLKENFKEDVVSALLVEGEKRRPFKEASVAGGEATKVWPKTSRPNADDNYNKHRFAHARNQSRLDDMEQDEVIALLKSIIKPIYGDGDDSNDIVTYDMVEPDGDEQLAHQAIHHLESKYNIDWDSIFDNELDEKSLRFDKSKKLKREISAKTKTGKRNARDIRRTKDEIDAEEYFI